MEAPGSLRMFVPGYRRMVKRFVKWANEDPNGYALTYGPWAGMDFRKMGVRPEKIVNWGYFVAPSVIEVERRGGGGQRKDLALKKVGRWLVGVTRETFEATTRNEKKLPRLVPLVEAVQTVVHHQTTAGSYPQDDNVISKSCSLRNGDGVLRILWCGRMLALKRVDTIIRAASQFKVQSSKFKVTLVGDGPEKGRLMRLAEGVGGRCGCTVEFVFLPSQPMEKVRELMREHDLFVFPSNGYEGWGAVVSEALEEGMRVLASCECGAGAALLPWERLFHSGDWKGLAKLIEKEVRGELPPCSIGEWTAENCASRLVGREPLTGGQYRNCLIV